MLQFPQLKTGAPAQYPASRSLRFQTNVQTFLDGGEQRFPKRSLAIKAWTLPLSLLDESEAAELQTFFSEVRGGSGVFEFVDPWEGGPPTVCRLSSDSLERIAMGEYDSRMELTIEQAP